MYAVHQKVLMLILNYEIIHPCDCERDTRKRNPGAKIYCPRDALYCSTAPSRCHLQFIPHQTSYCISDFLSSQHFDAVDFALYFYRLYVK